MYGAIIGDLAGSIYEYNQVKKVKPVKIDKIIEDNAFYSDDTILTVAVLDAILNKGNYTDYLQKYIKKYADYKPCFSPYFEHPFSPSTMNFGKNIYNNYNTGNGAMMRISPVGYLFNSEKDVILNAKLATIPSHNTNEAIYSATTIALMIYYFRCGLTKEEVYRKLNIKAVYKPFKKFNMTCQDTIGNCLYVIYNSSSFEDAIRKAILMGGDTDTNAAIVGSVAEAIYGIQGELISKAEERIPEDFVKILRRANKKVK